MLVCGVVFTIFTPQVSFFVWSASMAIQALALYVLIGIIFLIFQHQRLLFTSFGCAVVLALFLKGNFNPNFKLTQKTDAASFTVAQYTLSSVTTANQLIQSIFINKSDVLSIQEVNPGIKTFLDHYLKSYYPFSYNVKGIDFGTIIYSKFPFVTIDTVSINGIANVLCSFKHNGFEENIYLLSTYSTPPFSSKDYDNYRNYLSKIITWSMPIHSPFVLVGEMNAVPWSNEINYLKTRLTLKDCRRAYYPSVPNILERPMDHIFYNGKVSCIDFHELRDSSRSHIGIIGSFQKRSQFIPKEPH